MQVKDSFILPSFTLKINQSGCSRKKRREGLTDIYARIAKSEGKRQQPAYRKSDTTASSSALNRAIVAAPVPMAKESKVYMAAYTRLFTPQHILKYTIPSASTSGLAGVNRRMSCFPKICTSKTMTSVINRFRQSPVLVVFRTRIVSPAPIFWPRHGCHRLTDYPAGHTGKGIDFQSHAGCGGHRYAKLIEHSRNQEIGKIDDNHLCCRGKPNFQDSRQFVGFTAKWDS